MLEDILLQVNKPARYIGGEWNLPKKDFTQAEIKFALCFPDLYEIGMSNLGMRIIYGILNNIPDVSCERFFSPDCDLEKILRSNNIQILSLESKSRLKDFDIIGFSLGYELNYTNVLNILDLGGIPLKSTLRNETFPLIIGGGPCAFNPEPMHEFFDLFIVGEAEETILKIIDTYRILKGKFKASAMNKQELLVMFSAIEGVYAPSLYDAIYDNEGGLREFKPKFSGTAVKIKKSFVQDLNSAYFPRDWIIPYISIVHDRITLEIMRGCPNRCRFCQARSQYFPFRTRELNNILDIAADTYAATGYEEISLSGLSVSDYSNIEKLLESLVGLFKEKAVSLSLPSIKPKTMIGKISTLISTIKKTGLTFAPESATERLRQVLGKDFNLQDFFKGIEQAYASGYQHVKLYFMIGLPQEREEDLDAIIEFSNNVSQLRRKVNRAPAQVNISVNTLIPKPHTPFQWLNMEGLDTIKSKQDYLKEKINQHKRLKLSLHNRYMSVLEGIFSRGDRRLSQVVYSAFKRGARFDAWNDYFNWNIWQDAFSECNINPEFYLRQRKKSELLPWDFIDVGLSKEALEKEAEKINY